MKFRAALALGASLIAAGCSSGPPLRSTPYLTVSDTGALPPPTAQDLSAAGQTEVIGPFDRITIDVYGVEQLSRTVRAEADGSVAFPLVGVIEAAGMTPRALATTLQDRLAPFVRNPQVLVSIEESANRFVTIDGEVDRPGVVPIGPRMTLMQVTARAQGATEFARLSHIVVFRTVAGQRMAALYDLRAIRAGLYPDPELYSQDLVVVGESQARRIFRDVIQGSALLTTPIIALIQRR